MKIPIWVLATMAVIGAGAPAPAAAQNLPNQFVCPREIGESNADWTFRCDQEGSNAAQRRGEDLARQSQDVARQRAALEKQPALPATRNRILGRWAMPAARRGATDDPFGGLSNMLTNGMCGILFGNGAVEFRADRWVLHDADGATDLGPASYREGQDSIIYILPQKSLVQLLGLKLDTPGSLLVIGGSTPCSMLRVNEATPAPPAAQNSAFFNQLPSATDLAMQFGDAPSRAEVVARRAGVLWQMVDVVLAFAASEGRNESQLTPLERRTIADYRTYYAGTWEAAQKEVGADRARLTQLEAYKTDRALLMRVLNDLTTPALVARYRAIVAGQGTSSATAQRVNEATPTPPAAPAPPPPAPRATAAAPTGAAILSLATGLPTLAGLANPLAGRLWFLMRESFDSVLTRSGFVPPAGQTPMQGWIAACRQGAPVCLQALDAAAPSAATMAQMDAAGKTTFPGVPPGTYYVFGFPVNGSGPLFWNLRVDLKNGVNPVTLDQRNTVR